MNRKEFAYKNIQKSWNILEFAPYFNPLYPKKGGYKTEIVDVISSRELIAKAQRDPMIEDWSKIEDVDYIATSDYTKTIGKLKYYDLIAASHVIEHTTDIIAFLNDCSSLLKDDGIVRLFIPDKRYDFDCFRECVTTRTAIDTHYGREMKTVHSPGTVTEALFRGCWTNEKSTYIANSAYAYLADYMNLSNSNTQSKFQKIKEILNGFDENIYLDVHSWVVTPKSFEIMIYELNVLGFIDLYIDSIYTVPRAVEFFVDLRKGRIEGDDPDRRLSLYIDRKKEMIEEHEDALAICEIKKILYENNRPHIYIYGTGGGVDRILQILGVLKAEYEAHIVSDGMRQERVYNGHPVIELSEFEDSDDCIVLMGIEKEEYRTEILPVLEKRKLKVFF